MTELELLEEFAEKLIKQGKRKAKLYDGINSSRTPDESIKFAIEELGEVSGAITRERFELAKCECIDLAHTAFLIYQSLRDF